MRKVIALYFMEEDAEDLPIYSKKIDKVYAVNGNTGEFTSDNEWYDTDDGFMPLEKIQELIGLPVLSLAQRNSGFIDVGPHGNAEWYFTNKEGALKVFEVVKDMLIKKGYEIIG
jgi:hypothetical protein